MDVHGLPACGRGTGAVGHVPVVGGAVSVESGQSLSIMRSVKREATAATGTIVSPPPAPSAAPLMSRHGTEVEIPKRPEDTIHKIFLDPTGHHLLACLHGGETYYLHSSSLRPKRLTKWSGVTVEAVAFDAQRCNEVCVQDDWDFAPDDAWKAVVG